MSLSARAARPQSAQVVTIRPASARSKGSEPGTPREQYPTQGEHYPRECYTGDDLGGASGAPKSKGWAVGWRPPSAPSRKQTFKQTGGPGPIYLPSDRFQGSGPNGKGVAYSMHHSHRVPLSEKKVDYGEQSPGPIYMVKVRRHPAGKFSTSPTSEAGAARYLDVQFGLFPS